ncbi:arylformamidase [Neobacillus notoginsengisoli]|uniref:Kynurenine formamidase n=1 Tax=Neobacillus notoginsengisoli TaxID=1578198 RepID=A0A417Z0J8_9BACI|nr:arylformamidase [Neobacillus notoginsengisoli]RHW43536.1 arylformamidase [Neobacillus notoginsengisoli]
MTNKNWIDISQPLYNGIANWPGDTPFKYETAFSKEQTGSANIGTITTSVHIGTHVDAPFHFDNEGGRILDLDINMFIGPARVIDVSSFDKVDVEQLRRLDLDGVERLLLKTSLPNNPDRFPERIPELAPDLAAYLSEKGVRLLGVDLPSVDQLDSKDLATHHALYRHGIHILENLMLDQIENGDYELIALPLALKDADGSPVRAVIRKL